MQGIFFLMSGGRVGSEPREEPGWQIPLFNTQPFRHTHLPFTRILSDEQTGGGIRQLPRTKLWPRGQTQALPLQ